MTDREMLEEVDENGEGLTAWEIEFVESLTKFLKDHETLSPAQRMKLEQLMEQRCGG